MPQDKMTLEDWLDDLCVRFIINLPREDLSSVARICFQIEEAQWFYEDFIRPLDPGLPSMSLRTFSLKMFQHCPLLASFSTAAHLKAFDEFMLYKTRVPVRGAVMLNDAMDAAVLVRGYKKGASWSFPRGKINKDEDDIDCAVREVYEETGFDLRAAGLIEKNAPVHPLEVTMHAQQVRLYVFRGIPEDTVFETRTRKEIGAIRWYKLADLPAYRKRKEKGAGGPQAPAAAAAGKFYMVAPFMAQLRQWVLNQKKADAQNAPAYVGHKHPPVFYDENLTDDNMLQEPPRPSASGSVPGPGTHPENFDSATRELQRLLQIKPPTQGLQLPSPTATVNQQAGQTLLSILQPKLANIQIPAPQQGTANVSPPSVQHRPQHDYRIPVPDPSAPPPTTNIPVHSHASPRHPYNPQYPDHRPRPKVFVTNEIPPPRRAENPPVQLLHPQPLPPQVQKEMLLRELRESAVSPNVVSTVVGTANAPAPQGVPQGMPQGMPQGVPQSFGPIPSNNQYRQQPPALQGHNGYVAHPPQLPAHSANLLNVLKGSSPYASAPQRSTSNMSPLTNYASTHPEKLHQGEHGHMPRSGLPGQSPYGGAAPSSNAHPAATMNAPAPFSGGHNRLVAPTDQHRASLLDLFRTGQPTLPQGQIDGQSGSFATGIPRANEATSPVRQQVKQAPSTADVLKTAARDDGQPARWNPELNLPYGAHSILRRGPSRGSARSPAHSTRNSNDFGTQLPVRSHPSPSSSRGQMSTRGQMSPRVQMSPYQGYRNARIQSPKQQVPQVHTHAASSSSYPYGGNYNNMPNPLAPLQGASLSAATVPVTGMVKPRQNSTVEQRTALLTILGKPQQQQQQQQPDTGGSKGQNTVESTQAPASPRPPPRSRLASMASQGSGQSSATLLSPQDRNFLLGFLENASNNAKS
ncbi:hypothetical protein F4777DRAFT_529900 [Nemania sp. FL0916]|nr:hypothetical protein F4777DRAFT_529900 [Nemania sp. FL0916]